MPRGPARCGRVVVVVRRVMMMMMVMVGIRLPILVEHLTWPPGPTHGRLARYCPVGLPAPRGRLVLLACFPGCLSLTLVAHGWGVIRLQFSEHVPLVSKKSPLSLGETHTGYKQEAAAIRGPRKGSDLHETQNLY